MAKKINKSEHIRRFLAQHADAAPKAIVEALAKKNIEVTEFLASKIKYDKGRSKAAKKSTKIVRKAQKTSGTPSNGRRTQARKKIGTSTVQIDDLVAVKQLSDKIGGLATARRALDMLGQLR